MPLIRFNEHYLVQDGVRFLMTEDGERPVACRVSRGALHDLATKVGFSGSDDDIFETYRNLIEQAASDVYDADGPTDEHGRFLVTSEALIEAARRQ
jgi:Protein of unknown function (DUF1488)